MAWTGVIYQAATLTEDGNSGWLDIRDRFEGVRPQRISQAWLRMVPSNLAGNETLDLDLDVAFDEHGTGQVKIHDFTQVDNNDTPENLHIPGLESVTGVISTVTAPGLVYTAGVPPYWLFTWDVEGTVPSPSMTFVVYGILIP